MVWIPGGTFQMGSDEFPDAQPIHAATVNGFWMDEYEVTNVQFAKFVNQTGYITVAERPIDPEDFPGVPTDQLVPGSAVFTSPTQDVSRNNPLQWWQYVKGASWQHPKGPNSTIKGHEDAAAYAKWAGNACLPKRNGNLLG